MLQHNASQGREADRAHWAHAAVVAVHALCCGAPIVLLLAGATAVAVGAGWVLGAHAFLHSHELWLIALSALLVSYGGWAELRARKHGARHFPALWAVSMLCLAANVTLVAVHRL